MSSDNFKDLTPDDNYVSVDLTGDSIVLPPDAEDVILVVEGDNSISGTVNVELEHSDDNVNFTTAKNKPLTTGAGSTPSAPTIEAYFSRIPNPRLVPTRITLMSGAYPLNTTASVYLGELILNAIDASNPNGTYTIEITGPDAQYVEFRATNENARVSFLDNFDNEVLSTDNAGFISVQDPSPVDNVDQMIYASGLDYTSPELFLASDNASSSENKFNVNLKLRDSSHQMQQGHIITGINFKNKVELHTRAIEGSYAPAFDWVRLITGPLYWSNASSFIGNDRGLDISIVITPEFGVSPTPVTIYNPYVIRGVPSISETLSPLPYTASIGDSFGNLNFNIAGFSGFGATLPALDYEISCPDNRISLSGSTVQAGGSLTATLNTSAFSPFGGLSINAPIYSIEPSKGLNTYNNFPFSFTFEVQANPLVVSNGAITSPSNTAALGTDVCSVSVAGGLGTESIVLSLSGVDASYYRLNNVTTATTGSTITATSTDTVVLETNQAFSFSGYSHSVDINASFTDSYGTYTDDIFGISISQAGYTLTSSVASVAEGNTFTVDLNTTGTTAGDTIAYTITGVDSADINGASLTGNFTLSGTLDDAITFTVTADGITEGSETFTLTLDNGEDSVSVTINDTITPSVVYTTKEMTFTDATSVLECSSNPFGTGNGTLLDEWSMILCFDTSRVGYGVQTFLTLGDESSYHWKFVILYYGNRLADYSYIQLWNGATKLFDLRSDNLYVVTLAASGKHSYKYVLHKDAITTGVNLSTAFASYMESVDGISSIGNTALTDYAVTADDLASISTYKLKIYPQTGVRITSLTFLNNNPFGERGNRGYDAVDFPKLLRGPTGWQLTNYGTGVKSHWHPGAMDINGDIENLGSESSLLSHVSGTTPTTQALSFDPVAVVAGGNNGTSDITDLRSTQGPMGTMNSNKALSLYDPWSIVFANYSYHRLAEDAPSIPFPKLRVGSATNYIETWSNEWVIALKMVVNGVTVWDSVQNYSGTAASYHIAAITKPAFVSGDTFTYDRHWIRRGTGLRSQTITTTYTVPAIDEFAQDTGMIIQLLVDAYNNNYGSISQLMFFSKVLDATDLANINTSLQNNTKLTSLNITNLQSHYLTDTVANCIDLQNKTIYDMSSNGADITDQSSNDLIVGEYPGAHLK